MFTNHFGIEIEFTGITRRQAADVAAQYLGGTVSVSGDYYGTHRVTAPDGRVWKFMSDGSIDCQRKDGRRTVSANSSYSVELVSPILLYREDIDTVQGLARRLRKAGGFANQSCGIHIHLTAPATRLGASATLSTSSPAITICSTKPCRSHRSGCATAKRWTPIWWSG